MATTAKLNDTALDGIANKAESSYIDYSLFLSPDFDGNEYVNGIVQSAAGSRSQMHTSLATLTYNIQDLNKQLRDEISANYEDLLVQAAGIKELESVLSMVRHGMENVSTSLNRLRTKLHQPYIQLLEYQKDLERLVEVTDLLRRMQRFQTLARRAESQYTRAISISTPTSANKEFKKGSFFNIGDGERIRNITKTALTLKEAHTALDDGDLNGIEVVEERITAIKNIRDIVEEEGKSLFQKGVDNVDQAQIASGLQILYNLGAIKGRIPAALTDIQRYLEKRIISTLDTSTLHREVKAADSIFRGGKRSDGGAGSWSVAFWNRINTLMDDIASRYEKVNAIEKVITIKRDPVTQVSFLETLSTDLDSSTPTRLFWVTLSQTLESQLQNACNSSTFLQQTLGTQTGYMRLVRCIDGLFSQISSAGKTEKELNSNGALTSSPEAVLMRKAISFLESIQRRSANSPPIPPSRTDSPTSRSRSGSPAPGSRLMQSFFGGK